MKLLHFADCHLDSPFSGISSAEADVRRAELCESFVLAIELAKERNVDIILISGDVFDRPFCTASTKSAVFEALALRVRYASLQQSVPTARLQPVRP